MFFKELAEIATGMNLTLRINEKNGVLTISVLPDGIDKMNALNAVGTPEEMDAGFIEAIRRPLSDTKTMLTNQAEFIQNVQQQVKTNIEEAEKSKDKKTPVKKDDKPASKKPDKTPVAKKSTAPKPEKRVKEAPKKEVTPAPAGPKQLTIE